MATEYRTILGITNSDVTLANTTTLSTIYTAPIPGGVLGDLNKLIWDAAGKISFNGANYVTLYSFYAGVTVASVVIGSTTASQRLNNGLAVQATLAGDGSVNSQYGTIESHLGLPPNEDGSNPVGFGIIGAASSGAQDFQIKAKWSTANSNNSLTINGSSLELLSFIEDTLIPELDEPTLAIFIDSKLNNIRYDLRSYAYFYSELYNDLVTYCYGDVTFTRATSVGATWRDGASHSVAANEGAFEYNGEIPLGLRIITATETLAFSPDNTLHDSNTLCWVEEGTTYKSTKRGDTNIFNSSGVYVGPSGKHISNIVKFNKQLTTAEDSEIETALIS